MFRGSRLINLSSHERVENASVNSLSPLLLIFLARISSFQLPRLRSLVFSFFFALLFFTPLPLHPSPQPSFADVLTDGRRQWKSFDEVSRYYPTRNRPPGSINFNERAAVQLVIRNPARVLSGKRTVIRLQSRRDVVITFKSSFSSLRANGRRPAPIPVVLECLREAPGALQTSRSCNTRPTRVSRSPPSYQPPVSRNVG